MPTTKYIVKTFECGSWTIILECYLERKAKDLKEFLEIKGIYEDVTIEEIDLTKAML